ncbi:hypothetical protein GCK32_013770 [Trichostrongylus colubriformis]|uniref:ShKT domain-containing protein n=1 Tax=Trichostrongylus colubriformis TaxID=6319 RepID=A0AAN8FS36_TRICO
MFFYIFCGLLLLKVFAAEAVTSPSNSTSLLGRIKKLLAAAKEKFSKIFSFKSKTLPTECYDQAPEECSRLYAKGVCNYKDVAKEYCRTTCGFCNPRNHGPRSKEYIMSDEWDKIPNGMQLPSRASHVKNLGFDSMLESASYGFDSMLESATAKEKFSKMFSFESKTLPTECYDQAPEECYRLYEQGVCNHKDVAMEYCPITCGFCRSKNDGSRSGKYITSDEWDKIPNGHQAANRANP